VFTSDNVLASTLTTSHKKLLKQGTQND